MKRRFLAVLFFFLAHTSLAQEQTHDKFSRQRLDFAKTYFEIGGKGFASFNGKVLENSRAIPFEHASLIQPYLSWGGFHFWGHAEFYIAFPIEQLGLKQSGNSDFKLSHSVVTGMRVLPWVYQEKKIRPYLGASWSSIEFSQSRQDSTEPPVLSKDFAWVTDAGLLYGSNHFVFRLGVTYYPDNSWNYPLSETVFEQIHTPEYALHLGILYTFDASKNENPDVLDRWNRYPMISSPGLAATSPGDLFIGMGPSTSFSLSKSSYNQATFPFLKDQISSVSYFDVAIGYQFNRSGLFTALSFRNPEYQTEGFSTQQTIQKNSLTFEVNRYLFDYTGFAPYAGLNVAFDHIEYSEASPGNERNLTFSRLEPGITVGWDIIPGKAEEYLILRTNLRWYPFSSFEIDEKPFEFSQLEYNLIQAVFYPGRLLRHRAKKKR